MNIWQFLDANWFQTYIFLALITAIICGMFITIFKQIHPDVIYEEEDTDDINTSDI